MAHPPATKKPIPAKVAAWRKEVAGIRHFLDVLGKHRSTEGTKWVQSQRAYYRHRLDDLLDNAPPSLVKTGEARQARE